MTPVENIHETDAVRAITNLIPGDDRTDYDPLLRRIGDAPFVLLGEASHGTHEFYRERARITKRLIEEKGFTAVAVEADWPDAFRVNQYVMKIGDDADGNAALSGFRRFPAWMWRNQDVLNFVEWLRDYNDALKSDQPQAGFFGLDLYSLYSSIEAVLQYLEKVDPEGARRARRRYACFEQFEEDSQAYGYAASLGLTKSCEDEAVRQLIELQRQAARYAQRDGNIAAEAYFYAEQNAVVIAHAEEYYRSMFQGRANSWNLRDRHMFETLEALAKHLSGRHGAAKIVVWEHNSHVGDARATEMSRRGEWNVGQLIRERYRSQAVLVGFTTYTGAVTAASEWGGPHHRKRIVAGLPGSYEEFFHRVGHPQFFVLTDGMQLSSRLERAIGVIYLPRTERLSHYFHAAISRQFDAVIHIDDTEAVRPLDPTEHWDAEPPETYPYGL